MDDTNKPEAPLVLTQEIDGPWLAIRASDPARASSIVLVRKLPGLKPTSEPVNDQLPVRTLEPAKDLIALADFGVTCVMNPAAWTMRVRLQIDRTPRDPRNGCPRIWLIHHTEVIGVPRAMWDDVAKAAERLTAQVIHGRVA